MADAERADSGARPSVWRRVMSAPEGSILVVGVVLGGLYLAGVGLTRVWSTDLSGSLLSMTTAHVVGGRAAGISSGYMHGVHTWIVIAANMAIEAIIVMLCYPLFVLSYRKLIVIEPLRETVARAERTAHTHQAQIMRYGIPGLLLFVWFPFWMTGPVVGSVIGFLIGLRPWVNMAVVLGGTGLAIVCWGYVLQHVHQQLQGLGPYVPVVFVALILLVAISIRIRFAHSKPKGQEGTHDEVD